jgi:hypothetical protein
MAGNRGKSGTQTGRFQLLGRSGILGSFSGFFRVRLSVPQFSSKNFGQLYLNRHFDQLSQRTPPAIVSREHRTSALNRPQRCPRIHQNANSIPVAIIHRALYTSSAVLVIICTT